MNQENSPLPAPPGLRISDLARESKFGLVFVAGERCGSREIFIPHLQKPGLILAGHLEHLNPDKIQILGLTEISYLGKLPPEELKDIVDNLMGQNIVAFIVTKKLDPPAYFLQAADERGIPVLQSAERTSTFIKNLTVFLEKRLAPQTTMHGVLMSIQGVGVLILGKSGIGKSECALDLVYKGHRLVADDLIHLQRMGQDILVGYGPEIIKYHMEIRGLGIINIKDLFGVISVMDSAKVELVVDLVDWSESASHDRLGLEEETTSILDVAIPRIAIPVSPGRDLSVILEVAARNHLLKKIGYNAPWAVEHALREALAKPPADDRGAGETGS